MTKRTVYRIPPCPIWDLEATESWLGDLAKQGLHLKRMHSLLNFAAFQAGNLDLGVLARNLAEHDMAHRVFERRD